MIYVCIATRNDAATIGLLLWKIRQIFAADPREYQFLIADDASTDGTLEVLEPYQRALPLTLLTAERPRGYAAAVDALLREALARTDRPKRDAAVLIPGDFSVSPEALPDMLKRLDSGADIVAAEAALARGGFALRAVRRWAGLLLPAPARIPGLRDYLSGFYAFRLITVKLALRQRSAPLLSADGLCARAELLARTATQARQVATVTASMHASATERPVEQSALGLALGLRRTGRDFRAGAQSASPGGLTPSTP